MILFALIMIGVVFVLTILFCVIAIIFAGKNRVIQNQNITTPKVNENIYLKYSGVSDVKIDYVDFEGNKTERTISIKNVYLSNNKMYLQAFCNLRNEMRNFKIENISKMWIEDAEVDAKNYFETNTLKQ